MCVARALSLSGLTAVIKRYYWRLRREREELIGGGSASETPALLLGLYVRVFFEVWGWGVRRDLSAQLGAYNLWFICSFSPQYDKPFTRRSLCC